MKKTMNIDAELLAKARANSGAATDTEAVKMGLQELVRRGASERLRQYLGTEPEARDVPRRRESLQVRRATR